MDKQEIAEMAIRELTEHALSQRRENLCEEEQKLHNEVRNLSTQAHDIVAELSPEQCKILTDYFEKTNLIADHECSFLYVQGAKDCVELLKKLGAL
ncbi:MULTISPECIES: hypothetical protein [Caproicibacterium]|jgi:hypothetical protein|uniref:Uncharacterized protein n=1 Tax=Caproicibacterium argilliputei TaxID=3030016 RepID=A0AA97H3B8_9FIRM|nr:hypothetical protein [Caproicibacterium argilliputei]MDD3230247.1 hypothetical protein [Oscillospiraceae bacterium]WOC32103.1 hypothetical protein PXC00_13040 [Caproicibacterium argilliputei]